LFVNGTDIRGTGEMATDVPDGATVTILPPVAGA
jgi:molybdopterin converting factor small subunit